MRTENLNFRSVFYFLYFASSLCCSGSSSGSSSVHHSISVEEIQRGRTLLKSSKSYPDDILKRSSNLENASLEDADNSSSGVSSDQDIPPGPLDITDKISQHEHAPLPQLKSQRQQTGNISVFLSVIPSWMLFSLSLSSLSYTHRLLI